MRRHHMLGVAVLVFCGAVAMAQSIQSGPRAGSNVPSPFVPLVVRHAELPDHAGRKWGFTEQYGGNPYALIFIRTVSDPLASLLARLDGELAKHRDEKRKRSFGVVVLLSDDDNSDKQLAKFGERLNIKHISLAIDSVSGPRAFDVAKEADITLLLVKRHKIEANYAFRKDELRFKNIEQIIGDLQKMMQEPK